MQFQSQVLSNNEVSPGYFRMRMTAPPAVLEASAGQFVMVKVSSAIDPLLRRPFGIYDMGTFVTPFTDCGHQTFVEILYKVVGRGTGMLADLHQGDHLDIIAPLGKGFDLGDDDDDEEKKVLIGGGVGLAPLYLLAKELVKGHKVRLFAGGRSKEDVLCITEFERLGVETYVATDDGTLGDQGLVTQVMMKHLATGNKRKGSLPADRSPCCVPWPGSPKRCRSPVRFPWKRLWPVEWAPVSAALSRGSTIPRTRRISGVSARTGRCSTRRSCSGIRRQDLALV